MRNVVISEAANDNPTPILEAANDNQTTTTEASSAAQ